MDAKTEAIEKFKSQMLDSTSLVKKLCEHIENADFVDIILPAIKATAIEFDDPDLIENEQKLIDSVQASEVLIGLVIKTLDFWKNETQMENDIETLKDKSNYN